MEMTDVAFDVNMLMLLRVRHIPVCGTTRPCAYTADSARSLLMRQRWP
jgi:hypothetical protein